MKTDVKPPKIIAFCHIWKSGGMTLRYLLRRHFGVAHLDLEDRLGVPAPPWNGSRIIQARDLRFDLGVYPWVKSICGILLRPHVNFKENQASLDWYTFFRNPIKRYVSNYYFKAEVDADRRPFEEWIDDPQWHNLLVCAIAGKPDLDAAKELVETRLRFVGLTEKFDESLLVLRQRLDLPNFCLSYAKPKNIASSRPQSGFRCEVEENLEKYLPKICERNELDKALYEYVISEVWKRQVSEYGTAKLASDLKTEFQPRNFFRKIQHGASFGACMGYRNLVYKPLVRWDRWRCWRNAGVVDSSSDRNRS